MAEMHFHPSTGIDGISSGKPFNVSSDTKPFRAGMAERNCAGLESQWALGLRGFESLSRRSLLSVDHCELDID